MILHDDQDIYVAHFWHGGVVLLWSTVRHRRMTPSLGTVCTLHRGPCPSRERGQRCTRPDAVEGVTRYNPNDAYDRAKGRMHALARAMKAADLPLNVRTSLWKDYLKKTGILSEAKVG